MRYINSHFILLTLLTRFAYSAGIDSWVDPGGWLYAEMFFPSAGIHQSK